MKYLLFAFLISSNFVYGNIKLVCENSRLAFFREETANIEIKIQNDNNEPFTDASLLLNIDNIIHETASLNTNSHVVHVFRIDCSLFKPGGYETTAILKEKKKIVAKIQFKIFITQKWNPQRMRVWLWPHRKFGMNVRNNDEMARKQLTWYADKGFNSFVPAGGRGLQAFTQPEQEVFELFDYMLLNGLEAGFYPCLGYFEDVNDLASMVKLERPMTGSTQSADTNKPNVRTYVADAHSPITARMQNQKNTILMQKVKDFPQIGTCFFESEYQDFLGEPSELAIQKNQWLKNTVPHEFILPGVIPDNDEGYVKNKFKYKFGNGIVINNKRVAEVVHKFRPDILVFTDPFRSAAYLNLFDGLNCVSTWTYTNPDPKYMFFIESLIAEGKYSLQEPISTVTMLNYPGTIYPKDKGWTIMSPDILVETNWINFSRRPAALSVYLSSDCDPFDTKENAGSEKIWEDNQREPYQRYPASFEAFKKFCDEVVKPFGPMVNNLERTPRKVAILSSQSSRIYSISPTYATYYENYKIYDFYILLQMNHIPADVVFDETIQEYGLDDYDVLVMPNCETLLKSVYDKILAFQQRGGLIVSDQYLRAPLKDVVRFDFDFTYRTRVSADAIISNKTYAVWDDHLDIKSAELKDVNGITALDDQQIMELYAQKLNDGLNNLIQKNIQCSSKTALVNMLQKGNAKYLFIINDKRTYGERVGQYKAILEKGVEQDVNIIYNINDNQNLHVYDLLERKEIPVKSKEDGLEFKVSLPAAGGKIVAILPETIDRVEVKSIKKILRKQKTNIQIAIMNKKGLLVPAVIPIQLEIKDPQGNISAYSDYYAAKDGLLDISFTAAINDVKGKWTVKATELMSGKTCKMAFILE